jgi:hypothetical protein
VLEQHYKQEYCCVDLLQAGLVFDPKAAPQSNTEQYSISWLTESPQPRITYVLVLNLSFFPRIIFEHLIKRPLCQLLHKHLLQPSQQVLPGWVVGLGDTQKHSSANAAMAPMVLLLLMLQVPIQHKIRTDTAWGGCNIREQSSCAATA